MTDHKETENTFTMPFGKHAGQPISLVTMDEKYSNWLVTRDWTKFSSP